MYSAVQKITILSITKADFITLAKIT